MIGGFLIGEMHLYIHHNNVVYHYRADCDSETDLNRSTCSLTDNQRIGIYGGLLGSLTILAVLRAILFFILMLNASRVVHNRMFARVLRAPILFFDTNPVGE